MERIGDAFVGCGAGVLAIELVADHEVIFIGADPIEFTAEDESVAVDFCPEFGEVELGELPPEVEGSAHHFGLIGGEVAVDVWFVMGELFEELGG